MGNFGISLSGVGEFSGYAAKLTSLAGTLSDPGEMWGGLLGEIAEMILDNIDMQYETQGGHQWGGFEPLSDTYAAWKSAQGKSAIPDLQLSGDYRGSWSPTREGNDGIKIASSFEDTKHLWHEFGVGNNVERPVLVLTDQDLNEIDSMFSGHFDALIFRRL